MPERTSLPPEAGATLADMLRFLEHLPAADAGGEAIPPRVALDAYMRAVRELRAIAMEARARLEQTAVVVREAREFAHRRRRRAQKTVGKRRSDQIEGAR